MVPGKYGIAFEEAMCDLVVAFTAWHKPRCVLQLLIILLIIMVAYSYDSLLLYRLQFPKELERLLRYDKWVSREAFQENLESILFVS